MRNHADVINSQSYFNLLCAWIFHTLRSLKDNNKIIKQCHSLAATLVIEVVTETFRRVSMPTYAQYTINCIVLNTTYPLAVQTK